MKKLISILLATSVLVSSASAFAEGVELTVLNTEQAQTVEGQQDTRETEEETPSEDMPSETEPGETDSDGGQRDKTETAVPGTESETADGENTVPNNGGNTEEITDGSLENQEEAQEPVQDIEDIPEGTIVTNNTAEYPELEGLENIEASRFIIRDTYGIRFAETEQPVNAQEYIAQLKVEDASILFAQPDYTMKLNGVSDGWAFQNTQDLEMAEIEASQLDTVRPDKLNYSDYAFGAGTDSTLQYASGSGAVIAVLDTAMDTEHEQIAGHLYQNTKETADGTDTDGNGYIDDICGWDFVRGSNAVCVPNDKYDAWHATAIAGVIAQTAPESAILPLKVFENGQAYTSDIIRAIAYCRSMGVQVINCSWSGTEENPLLKEMMAGCTDMLFVCAAGNDGTNLDEKPVYPAAYTLDNSITVSSVNEYGQLSPFSNYSAERAMLAAPGERIVSSTVDGAYGEVSGTSFSAAFASGAAALIQENMTPAEIKEHMGVFAVRLYSLKNAVRDGQMLSVDNLFEQEIHNQYLYIRKKQPGQFALFDTNNMVLSNIQSVNDGAGTARAAGWETCGSMPHARSNMASAVWGSNIYVFGGTESGTPVSKTEMYNTQAGTWTTKATMPEERYRHTAAEINGKVYICGGYSNAGAKEDIDVYDAASNTWTGTVTVPNHNTNYGAAVYGGKLYIFGGKENGKETTNVYGYDPQTQVWEQLPSMTECSSDAKAIAYNEGIRVFAGWNVFEYNIQKNSWRALGSIGREVSDFAVVTRDLHNSGYQPDVYPSDAMYVTGGLDQGSTAATVETRCFYGDRYGLIATKWYRDLRLIRGLACHNMVVVDGCIYAFGGQRDKGTDQELMFRRSESEFPDDIPDWKYGTIVNGYIVGAINNFDDVDTFQFTVDETAYYNVRDLEGGLYPHNTCISVKTRPNDPSGLDYIGEIPDFWLKEGVTYYLYVGLSTSYDSAGDYDLRLVKRGDDAPDSLDKASEITLNTPYTKTFSTSTDNDCMYIESENAGRYVIHMKTMDGTNADVTVYNAGKQQIDTFAAEGETEYIIQLEKGRYYIRFAPGTMYQAQAQDYSFQITQYGEPGKLVQALMSASAVCADGTMYVVGGTDQNYQLVDTIQRFDTQGDMFVTETTIPNPSKGAFVASAGNKIYVIDDSGRINSYDTKTKKWSYEKSLVKARERAGIASDGRKIYIAGGRRSGEYLDTMEIYDTETGSISAVKLPESSMDTVLACVNGKVYLAGGVTQDGYSNRVYMYDEGGWTEKRQMPYAAEQIKGTVYGDGILFVVSEGKTNKIVYYNTQTNKWVEQDGGFQRESDGETMQQSVLYYDVQNLGNKLYLTGGHDGENLLRDLYCWDLSQINENDNSSSELETQTVMGKSYPVVITVKDISSFAGKQFIVDYDADIFDAEDLCAQTWQKDTAVGNVSGTDIYIVSAGNGQLVFECRRTVPGGKTMSGAINTIMMRAKKTGSGNISVKMSK